MIQIILTKNIMKNMAPVETKNKEKEEFKEIDLGFCKPKTVLDWYGI